MKFADTHCHLYDEAFDADRDEVLARALDSLEWIVVIGEALETSQKAHALTRDRVYCAVGAHPYHAETVDEAFMASLRELAGKSGVVAIGEIGLDYFNWVASAEIQQRAFRRQLELAVELELPVVIHDREAHDDVAKILEEFGPKLPGGIMHCFSGDAAFAERSLKWGFHISFAGNVTYPKATQLRDAALAVPLDRILVETDSPYLAPKPMRGRRCEPGYVMHTGAALAEVRGIAVDEFAAMTTENGKTVFF
jgi:TatD DNase family protein